MALAMAAALLSFAPPEQAQAQLYIDIFPSQDDTNATLWVFSGSSRSGVTIANVGPHIRTSGSYNQRDTVKTTSALFATGTTTTSSGGVHQNLTPLFTASATNAPLDLVSLRTRLGQTIKLGTTNTLDDITIPSNATNTPTLNYTNVASRTIARMYFRDVPNTGWDDIGPRTSSQLTYGTGQPQVAWYGAAIMTNKPISHFVLTNPFAANANDRFIGNRPGNAVLRSWTNYQEKQGLRIRVHGAVIPEPQEYALVFGLFALAFVFFHRHFQKKKRQAQQSAPTS